MWHHTCFPCLFAVISFRHLLQLCFAHKPEKALSWQVLGTWGTVPLKEIMLLTFKIANSTSCSLGWGLCLISSVSSPWCSS